jgi:hypothetical protein
LIGYLTYDELLDGLQGLWKGQVPIELSIQSFFTQQIKTKLIITIIFFFFYLRLSLADLGSWSYWMRSILITLTISVRWGYLSLSFSTFYQWISFWFFLFLSISLYLQVEFVYYLQEWAARSTVSTKKLLEAFCYEYSASKAACRYDESPSLFVMSHYFFRVISFALYLSHSHSPIIMLSLSLGFHLGSSLWTGEKTLSLSSSFSPNQPRLQTRTPSGIVSLYSYYLFLNRSLFLPLLTALFRHQFLTRSLSLSALISPCLFPRPQW